MSDYNPTTLAPAVDDTEPTLLKKTCALLYSLLAGSGDSNTGGGSIAHNRTVIFCCNSIGQPYGLIGNVSFPNLFASAWENQGDTVIQFIGPANTPNLADSITDTITNYAATIGLYTPAKTGRPLLVVLPNCGSSDVINGGDTAAQIYTKVQTLIGMIHADGGKVMIGTIVPGSYYTAGAVDTRRTDTNTLLASDLTIFDYYWPMASLLSVDTASYFGADNQHLSPFGHILAAASLFLAQDSYYRNGDTILLRSNELSLTPLTDSDKAIIQVQAKAGTSVLSFGIFDPALADFGGIWFGPIVPSSSNFGIIGNGTATMVLNAPTQVLTRINNVTTFSVLATSVAVAAGVVFFPAQATTVGAPTYVKGGMYFDTTLNKMRIGGAIGWETVTSV